MATTAPPLNQVGAARHSRLPPRAFVSSGFVSLAGTERKVPVNILRDTGSDVTLISSSVLPFSDESDTGDSVLVMGMGLQTIPAPLHTVMIESDLTEGKVVMGVVSGIPGRDGAVDILLGNDLAGLSVYPGVPPPIVSETPQFTVERDLVSQSNPEVFTACAVTRAMSKSATGDKSEAGRVKPEIGVNLSELSFPMSKEELIEAQKADETLSGLFDSVLPASDIDSVSQGYFLQEGVLLRKSIPHIDPVVGEPVAQLVVQYRQYRDMVLKVAHDQSGHSGVRKTFDRVIRSLYWPKLKRKVASYVRTCHTCQLTGKPNQCLKPAPLHPIPAIGQPFEHLIIDCVGPLPCAKTGSIYLLTKVPKHLIPPQLILCAISPAGR